MPILSALQYAEHCQFSQVRAFAGDVIYTEGMPSDHMYVVKEGEVDLYLIRDEKRVVIETLRKGQCFGVTLSTSSRLRTQNAAARSYCELFLVGNKAVDEATEASSDLVQHILDALSSRLTAAHELIATRVNYQPDLQVYAQLLHLLGVAEVGKQAATGRGQPAGQPAPSARPSLQDVMANARLMFGHSDKHIRSCLDRLVSLHVICFDDDKGAGKQVVFSPRDIVGQVRKLASADADHEKLSYEYIGVNEFSTLVEADRGLILRKLAGGDFVDDIFTFRRTEILRLLNEKGKRYFVERKIKQPADFTEIADIEFADAKSVFAVVSKVDTYDLAKVLSTLDEGAVRDKILNALSRRRRDEVENDLRDIGAVDPLEAQQIGTSLIGELKAFML